MRRIVAIVVLLYALVAWADSRYDELARVVNRNTGFAHMTLRDASAADRKLLTDYPLC